MLTGPPGAALPLSGPAQRLQRPGAGAVDHDHAAVRRAGGWSAQRTPSSRIKSSREEAARY